MAKGVSNSLTDEKPADSGRFDTVAEVMAAFDKFLAAFGKRKMGRASALKTCFALIRREASSDLVRLLDALPSAWADHAVASVYAMRLPAERRKQLGAYFTPPHLVDHLVTRLSACGMDAQKDRLRDPAAGGAAFLVPLARIKVAAWKRQGLGDAEIVIRLCQHLIGREIEVDLAKIANALLRRMLIHEFKVEAKLISRLAVVKVGNSLDPHSPRTDVVDHEIGNPPFLRLGGQDPRLANAGFREVTSGRGNLYALFVRRALEEVPSGGLIGYVIPASFLGGPEFAKFRKRVLQLADVLVIDVIEKRSDVFLDAIQDACFVILKRRINELAEPSACSASSGVFRHNGDFLDKGKAEVLPDGGPWRLPGIELLQSSKLKDWGYKATVGYLVSNRQPERLHPRPAKGRYPLIWAKAITPEGRFDFDRGATFKGSSWVDAPGDAAYVVRTPCVAVQRTSSRGQKRRLNAAPVSKRFIRDHGGVVAENHVILLVPVSADAAPPEALAEALNRAAASSELDRVCGAASISVRLLEGIELGCRPPRPAASKEAQELPRREPAMAAAQ